jgi:hypothetical protein
MPDADGHFTGSPAGPALIGAAVRRRLELVAAVMRDLPAEAAAGPVLAWRDGAGLVWRALTADGWVGRAAEGMIAIERPGMSRRHFRLEAAGAGWRISDSGSTNGTRVNAVVLGPEPRELADGDVIEAGGVALIFLAGDADSPGGTRKPTRGA